MTTLAVAYIRASKEEQKLTLEGQRQALESYAAANDFRIAAVFVDADVCSVTPIEERPGLMGALGALGPKNATGAPRALLVVRRDRLARDVMLSCLIDRAVRARGGGVVSVAGEGNGEGPADEFMRTVIDGAAQYERALIRARTKAALQVRRSQGRSTGPVPYGYLRLEDGRLEPHPGELSQIALARSLAAQGVSQRDIARRLGPRRDGRPFQQGQVWRLLRPSMREAEAAPAGAAALTPTSD